MYLLIRLGIAWAINIGALWVADALWDGVQINGTAAYLIGAAVLGIANTIIKPILAILTLPLILSRWAFSFLINIAMVALAEWIALNFSIDGFWGLHRDGLRRVGRELPSRTNHGPHGLRA
jgi:putative membrane protein